MAPKYPDGAAVMDEHATREHVAELAAALAAITAERDAALAEAVEARRRRDEWRQKAEGYDAVRLALREKVGAPWPPHMSRALWAGIAADEKKRADDAEAARDDRLLEADRLVEEIGHLRDDLESTAAERDAALAQVAELLRLWDLKVDPFYVMDDDLATVEAIRSTLTPPAVEERRDGNS